MAESISSKEKPSSVYPHECNALHFELVDLKFIRLSRGMMKNLLT